MTPSETLDRSAWRNGLSLILLIWLLTGTLYRQADPNTRHDGELWSSLAASKLIKSHQSEYANGYAASPLPVVTLRPLAKIDPIWVNDCWHAVCVLCMIAAIGFFCLAAEIKPNHAAAICILFVTGFTYRPTLFDFQSGDLDLPVLALLCGGFMADRFGRGYRLATCIALAALIKLWLIALLVYLIFRRRIVPLIWGLILFSGCMAALFARVGWRELPALGHVALQWTSKDYGYDFSNQSLLGFARVHFGPNASAEPLLADPILLYGFVSIGLLAILIGLTIAFRADKSWEMPKRRMCLCMTLVSLLLICPISRQPSFVLLLPAVWTLLVCDGVPGISRLIAALAFVLLTDPFSAAHPSTSGWQSLAYSAFFFAAVLVWLALLLAITRRQKRDVYIFEPAWD